MSLNRIPLPSTRTSPPRGLVFQLVSRDATGIARPLPTQLGPLPLYPLDDGCYSVLGPPLSHIANEDPNGFSNDSPTCNYTSIDTTATPTPPRAKYFCGSSKCSGNRFAPSSAVS